MTKNSKLSQKRFEQAHKLSEFDLSRKQIAKVIGTSYSSVAGFLQFKTFADFEAHNREKYLGSKQYQKIHQEVEYTPPTSLEIEKPIVTACKQAQGLADLLNRIREAGNV